MNKHQEKAAATREALTDAFCRLYRQQPIEKIAIKEIVAIAGCNRTTFYQHFTSIYDVLETLEDGAINRLTESIGSVAVDSGQAPGFLGAFLSLCRQNADLFGLLLQGSCGPRFKDRLRERVRPLVEAHLGIEAQRPNASSCYLVDFYLAGVIEVASSCITSDEKSIERAGCIIEGILTQGVISTANEVACFDQNASGS